MSKIKTYECIKDEKDNLIEGLKILTVPVSSIQDNGSFISYTASTATYADSPSVILIIDDNTLNQIEKTKLVFENHQYQLLLIDGEEFTYPIETPEQIKIRELKEQLAILEATQKQGEQNYE